MRGRILLLISSIIFSMVLLEVMLRSGIVKNKLHDEFVCGGETAAPKCSVLLLGDSFCCILRNYLFAELAPHKVKALNAARSGMGPFHYLSMLKIKGASFRPDLTVLFYYVGNDLTSVQYARQSGTSPKDKIIALLRPLFERAYIYYFFDEKKSLLLPHTFDYDKLKRAGMDAEVISLARDGKINPWLLKEGAENRNYFTENILMDTKENMKAWEKVKALFSEMADASAAIGSEFAIVIVPSVLQVNKTRYSLYRKMGFNADERMLRSDKPQQLLKKFCEEKNIQCLDLLPYLKAEKDEELYFENDDHFNKAGNELVAKIVSDFLLKQTSLEGKVPDGHETRQGPR